MRHTSLPLALMCLALASPATVRAEGAPALRSGMIAGQPVEKARPVSARETSGTLGFRQVEDAHHWTGGSRLAGPAMPASALSGSAPERQLPTINYIVMDQPLDAVMAELGRLAGYATSVSREVRGRINAGRLTGRAEALLDDLRRQHNLVTMREGGRLHVAAESETVMRVMRTGAEPASRIRQVLRTLTVDDLARRVIIDEAAGLVQIHAPPTIAERIETLLTNASRSGSPDATDGITLIRFGKRVSGD